MEAEITFRKRFKIREDQDPEEIGKMYIETMGFEVVEVAILYDPNFGDDVECECGHPYYRHFDSYEGMSPVGCKYCHGYVEGVSHRLATPVPEGTDTTKWTSEDWQNTLSICMGFRRKK
jgi:hypothetical protein